MAQQAAPIVELEHHVFALRTHAGDDMALDALLLQLRSWRRKARDDLARQRFVERARGFEQ